MKSKRRSMTRDIRAALGMVSFVLILSSCLSSTSTEPSAEKVPLQGKIVRSFGISTDPVDGRISVHPGIDIAAEPGTLVRSVGDGEVEETGENELMGKYVIVRHARAKSVYAQLGEILVTAGKAVRRGEPVGKSGSSGKSAYPHLYFGVYVDGTPIDPVAYVNIN